MNMLASGFGQFVNGIFANWQMILFVLLTVLLILIIVFRKVKVIKFIGVIAVPAILVALIASLVVAALSWTVQEALDFGVKWSPTILFALIVVFQTWLNSWRGLRKSLILLLHSVIIGAVCIILYCLLISVPEVDGFMLKFADLFTGGSGSFKRMLGVTAECYGLKDVFVCWLPTVLQGDFSVMLGGSAAYIYTLADLIYHVAFALLLLIVYYILDFIMYIIYHCCYSERKYRRKIAAKYIDNKVDRRYSRHIVGGGVVGIVRGVAIGLLSLSFLGTSLYIVAGRGDGKLKDYDFGNSDVNEYYSVYRSIESYGTYGIFKVLNSISSTDDVPYYLFAADLIFSGELDDSAFGVSDHIVFREELDAYRGFAVDTMELLLKYGGEDIKPLINGNATESAFDAVMKIMCEEGFRYEFNDLISEFDAQTYIINFALSFVNSAIANIDSMSFAQSISADNKELLKILFTKGYMSDYIPDERIINSMGEGAAVIFERPYINISKLITKQDAQTVFNIVIDVLTNKISNLDDSLALVGKLIPEIKTLSVLSADRSKEFDPVLGRLYCYAANRYLSEEGSQGVTYAEIYEEGIEWVSEINSLIDVADSALKLVDNIYKEGAQPQDIINTLFDKNDKNYADNCKYYDDVCDSIIKSRVLGKALSTSFVYNNMVKAMRGVFKSAYVPETIVYESRFDGDGKLVSAGETYLVLNAVRIIGRNTQLLPTVLKGNVSDNIGEIIDMLTEALLLKDERGKELLTYFTESDLLRSVISATLIDGAEKFVYVPSFARETDADGNRVCFIAKDELSTLLNSFDELKEIVQPVIDGGDVMQAIADFTEKEIFRTLLDGSTIFEGTVGKLLVEYMSDDSTVVIPAALKNDLDGWASERGRTGETKRLIDAFDVIGIKIGEITSGDFDSEKIKDSVLSLTVEELDESLKSQVLHYTLSNQLVNGMDFGSFSLIVPLAAQHELKDDSLKAVVKKSEIENILKIVSDMELSEDTDVSQVLVKLVSNKSTLESSYILSASVAYSLVNEESIKSSLTVPQTYEEAASKESLQNFNSSNPWKIEIVRLIDALDDIMGISSAENFTFDDDTFSDSLSDFLKNMNVKSTVNSNVSRITLCYASKIVSHSITGRLDELLEGKVDETLLSGAKSSDGNYSVKELSALSGALNIFDIDIMNVDTDVLIDKVTKQIFTLNDPAEGEEYQGQSKLDVIYPSIIISGMISNELDASLLEDGNDDANMIDREVLYAIKNGKRYDKNEIALLINSANEFGINSFDEIDGLDFNTLKNKQDKIEDICQSRIVRGVLTKQISKNDQIGADHPKAYDADIKIFRTQEIASLVRLIDAVSGEGNDTNIEDMYFDDIRLADLKDAIYAEDGSVSSYLVLSAASRCVRENANLLVNVRLVDSYGCINSTEMYALIEAFNILEGDDISLGTWSAKKFDFPKKEQREKIFESQIVRAKITEQFITTNAGLSGGTDNYLKADNFTEFTDFRSQETAKLISGEQLICMCNAIDGVGYNGYEIPQISIGSLSAMYQHLGREKWEELVKTLYDADVLRYKICDQILENYSQSETYKESVINLVNGNVTEKDVLTYEQVVAILTPRL